MRCWTSRYPPNLLIGFQGREGSLAENMARPFSLHLNHRVKRQQDNMGSPINYSKTSRPLAGPQIPCADREDTCTHTRVYPKASGRSR